MKKLVLIAFLALPFFMVSQSQAQIKFGIKAGLTSTSIKADEVYTDINDANIQELKVKGQNANVGFQGGIFSRITIVNFYVQPELLFTSTSGEVEVTTLFADNQTESVIKDQKFRQIDIPIMLGYKFGPVRLQAGPVGTIMLDSDPALSMVETLEVKEEFNGATWGYQVGVGLDILKKVTIDVKYEGNLSKLGDGVKIAGQNRDFDSRNSQFIATVGIFF
ncbi:MAG TPA: porin family protein [Bacteroidales bacterium]|nr:porin family protein [Bacteroidales bacterium]